LLAQRLFFYQKRKNRPKAALFVFFAGSAPVTNGERHMPFGLFA